MERLKEDSQVGSVVMRGPRLDRRSAAGSPSVPATTEDVDRQARAGEEDQSSGTDGIEHVF